MNENKQKLNNIYDWIWHIKNSTKYQLLFQPWFWFPLLLLFHPWFWLLLFHPWFWFWFPLFQSALRSPQPEFPDGWWGLLWWWLFGWWWLWLLLWFGFHPWLSTNYEWIYLCRLFVRIRFPFYFFSQINICLNLALGRLIKNIKGNIIRN